MTVVQGGNLMDDEPMQIDQTNADTFVGGLEANANDDDSYCEK